jgi:hypothetical protein
LNADATRSVEEVGGFGAGELDHVHRGHRQAGAIDDAADLPIEPDVVQPVLRRFGLARIFFGVVPQLADVRPAKERVVVELHLGVERQDAPVDGDGERVDLDHGGIQITKGTVGAQYRASGIGDLGGFEAESEAEFPRLEPLHTDGGLDDYAHQALGPLGRDLFDLHPAFRGGDDADAFAAAIEDEADVQLLGDRYRRLDVQALYQLALRARLLGDQHTPEEISGGGVYLVLIGADADAAGLAAAAGVDLGFDHPPVAADLARAVDGLIRGVDDVATGDWDAEVGEELFGLILVYIHKSGSGGHEGQ